MEDGDARVAGLAAKINREEAYHRMHAEMWRERLADTRQFRAAVDELWPYAVAMLPPEQREALAQRVSLALPSNSLLLGKERGMHDDAFTELHDEMTVVRRSAPAGAQW
jgi:1,2-phenylacetyl-CoA epoxidase catalytic subunit